MEYSKENILILKNEIKKLAAEQKSIKPQRKTIYFIGTRTLPAWKAAYQHQINRYDLRHLYIAYGFMRGKTIEQIEPKRTSEFGIKKVEKILETYAQAVCVDTQ